MVHLIAIAVRHHPLLPQAHAAEQSVRAEDHCWRQPLPRRRHRHTPARMYASQWDRSEMHSLLGTCVASQCAARAHSLFSAHSDVVSGGGTSVVSNAGSRRKCTKSQRLSCAHLRIFHTLLGNGRAGRGGVGRWASG